MEVTLLTGQTLWDLALSHKGSWEAGIDLARSRGVSMTARHPVGTTFVLTSAVYDRLMERYARTHRLSPATAASSDASSDRVFTLPFSDAFR